MAYSHDMADNRQLKHSEKRLAVFTSEKGRDRADARRQIEGLNQQDALIQLMVDQNNLLAEQNEQLRYIAARLYAIETRGALTG